MGANTTERDDFIAYPTNRVVGTVPDAASADAAIDALLQAGFDRQDIELLHGETGEQRLDPEGVEHGWLAQLQRALIRTAHPAEEHKHLMHHLEDVRAGRFVIMVLAKERAQRALAADVMNAHGAEFVGFYGRWAWEGLPPHLSAADDTDAGHERHPVASRAEDIPALFVKAWNSRDPDALASLFDADAEFVNVTGLWWHDRDSIRKAHAYGLERIFNESTLSVDEIRTKPLSNAVAVVHARMILSNQTTLEGTSHPGTRRTIFSFVLHRADHRWQCASAHNTDVVPNMETNIVDDEGHLRSANYRTGRLSG